MSERVSTEKAEGIATEMEALAQEEISTNPALAIPGYRKGACARKAPELAAALRSLAAERDELARSLGLARTDAYQRGYADGKMLAAGSGEMPSILP